MSHFLKKNCRFGRYLTLIGLILYTVKQIIENLRLDVYARMFWEPMYKILYP